MAICLTKGLGKSALDCLQKIKKNRQRKKAQSNDGEKDEDLNDNDKSGDAQSNVLPLQSAKEQQSALLSFKRDLCSGRFNFFIFNSSFLSEFCCESVINAFRIAWSKESVSSSDETKKDVAICMSYFRFVYSCFFMFVL